MKKKLIFAFVLAILIVCLVCVDKIIIDKKVDLKYDKVMNLKIGDEIVYYADHTTNAPIKWDNIKDEDGKIYYAGTYKGEITYKNKKYSVVMIVKDDTKPTIEGVTDLEVIVDSEIDLLENVEVTDDSHDDVDVKVTGNYDLSKTGVYNLKVKATDKSNNSSEVAFKLTVKDKNKKVSTKTSSKGYKIEVISGITYVNGILVANKTYSLPTSYNPGGLLKDFTENFEKMRKAALEETQE